MIRILRTFFCAVSLLLMFLFLWQTVIFIFNPPAYLLPQPVMVIKTLYEQKTLLFDQSLPTLSEALTGFVLGSSFGSITAVILHRINALRRLIWPALIASQALPAFALAPLLVLWLGYGQASKIAVCTIMLFFPVTSAFYDGLMKTPLLYLELAQSMKSSTGKTLKHIRIPFALPFLGSGLRLAAVYAPMGAMLGEWVGSSKGLGFLLLKANAQMQTDLVFAILIMIIALTLIFYFIVDKLLNITLDRKYRHP